MLIFYKEWLHLSKSEFRLLAMLADLGIFMGSLTDICKYFSINAQSKTRNSLKKSIAALAEAGFIHHETNGNTQKMTIIPKGMEITIPRQWYEAIKRHDYSSESVAWETVLKVYLWATDNKMPVITDVMIAAELNISTSTVSAAQKVLEFEYNAIMRKNISEKMNTVNGEEQFRKLGHEILPTAWWAKG